MEQDETWIVVPRLPAGYSIVKFESEIDQIDAFKIYESAHCALLDVSPRYSTKFQEAIFKRLERDLEYE